MTNLTPELIKSATIIDVRTDDEVAEGMFPNAIHICLDDLPSRLDDIEKLSFPLVLYCRSGNRSGHACRFLEDHGFEDIHNGINLETLTRIAG